MTTKALRMSFPPQEKGSWLFDFNLSCDRLYWHLCVESWIDL
jgi:hypothetical protein